jgi:hypothetical protein
VLVTQGTGASESLPCPLTMFATSLVDAMDNVRALPPTVGPEALSSVRGESGTGSEGKQSPAGMLKVVFAEVLLRLLDSNE